MVKVFPFKGIYYNKKKVKNLSKVMTPPYDVISPAERDEFYAASNFNITRLILGKEFPGDSEINNKYLRAEKFLHGWLNHGILIQDEKPCIYIYEQKYSYAKKQYARRGFISLLRLEDFGKGKVFPHEHTLSKPKLDRLELIKTTSANLDCVFSLFSDEKNKIEKVLKKYTARKPLIDVVDSFKIKNRLWRIDKKVDIKRIMDEMSDKPVFIADGHHRYEAALKFRDEMKDKIQKFSGDEAYDHVMMYFTPVEGKGLTILPIHRAIHNIPELDLSRFEDALAQYFTVETLEFNSRTEEKMRKKMFEKMRSLQDGAHAFGMLAKGANRYYVLTLRDEKIMDKLIEADKPKEWKRLDVTIVHSLIIEKILGISKENVKNEDHIVYVKDPEEAVNKVKKEDFQIVIFLNNTKVTDILAIAAEKEKMPQKSTFFYPKLLTGVLMNKILLDEKIAF